MKCLILINLLIVSTFCKAQDSIKIYGLVFPEEKYHPSQKIRNAEIIISNFDLVEINRIKTDTNGYFNLFFLPVTKDSVYQIRISALNEKQFVIDSFCRFNITRTPSGYQEKYLIKRINELNDSLFIAIDGPLICTYFEPVVFKENSVKFADSLISIEQLTCISNSYKKFNLNYPERLKLKISYSSFSKELDTARIKIILNQLRNLIGIPFSYIIDDYSGSKKDEFMVVCAFFKRT